MCLNKREIVAKKNSDVRVGVVGLPGKWSTETLADAVEQETGFRLVIDMNEVCLDLTTRQLIFKAHNLCDLDGLIIKKISTEYSPNTLDRLEMLRVAEAAGVRVFSQPLHILRLIDRLSCTVTLRNNDIAMPPTLITECEETALQAVKTFGSAIFKPLYSTKARGMVVLESAEPEHQQRMKIQQFQKSSPMLYIQKKLLLPGRDLGMVFLGGEYLGTYARVSQADSWNTTINSGGKYAHYEASAELIDLACRAQKPFAMDFTTVDVAESEAGPVVFEVSAFGGFRGAKEGIGIDAAKRYTDYVLASIAAGRVS